MSVDLKCGGVTYDGRLKLSAMVRGEQNVHSLKPTSRLEKMLFESNKILLREYRLLAVENDRLQKQISVLQASTHIHNIPQKVEVKIKTDVKEAELQSYLNDRWEILMHEMKDCRVNVVLRRVVPDGDEPDDISPVSQVDRPTPSVNPTPLKATVAGIVATVRESFEEKRTRLNEEIRDVIMGEVS